MVRLSLQTSVHSSMSSAWQSTVCGITRPIRHTHTTYSPYRNSSVWSMTCLVVTATAIGGRWDTKLTDRQRKLGGNGYDGFVIRTTTLTNTAAIPRNSDLFKRLHFSDNDRAACIHCFSIKNIRQRRAREVLENEQDGHYRQRPQLCQPVGMGMNEDCLGLFSALAFPTLVS